MEMAAFWMTDHKRPFLLSQVEHCFWFYWVMSFFFVLLLLT